MTTAAFPRLPPHRRDHRVGHPGRRRQGQGAQGGRPAGDRFRGRRARLPDPRLHRRGGRRGLPRPALAPLHPGRRPARAEGGDRGQDRSATPATRCRPSQVLVTNGGKQAVYEAFATLLDPGDEVLLPAPYWTTYPESIRLAGGVPVEVLTDEASGYLATVEQLEAATTDRTKVLLFVSPSNPTGAVYSPEQVEEIGRWAAERGLWVVTDEIYEHLVYGDARFASMPTLVPELADRCVVVNGVAKTYAMTGWRVGWLIGPDDVVKAATNLQSHATSNVANVSQVAALAAVRGDLSAVADDARGVRPAPADDREDAPRHPGRRVPGAVRRVLRLPVGQGRARQASCAAGGRPAAPSSAELVLEEVEVAVVPGEAFGTPGYVRMSYALGDDDLVEGVTRLHQLLGRGHARLSTASAGPARAAEGPPAPALHRVAAAGDAARAGRRARGPAAGRPGRGGRRPPARAAGDRRARLVPVPAAVRRGPLGGPRRGRRPPAGARGRPGRRAPRAPAGWRSRSTPRRTRRGSVG